MVDTLVLGEWHARVGSADARSQTASLDRHLIVAHAPLLGKMDHKIKTVVDEGTVYGVAISEIATDDFLSTICSV